MVRRTRNSGAFRTIAVGISLTLIVATALLPDPAGAVIILPPSLTQPTWAELTPQQRAILMPLSGEWDQLESFRRKKWLGIAQRYPRMSADEQQRVQRRMKDWISLSPDERREARNRYKNMQKAPPEHREAVKQRWQAYKSLPDAEKHRLRQQAKEKERISRKGAAKNPVSGLPGAAVKPVPAVKTASDTPPPSSAATVSALPPAGMLPPAAAASSNPAAQPPPVLPAGPTTPAPPLPSRQ